MVYAIYLAFFIVKVVYFFYISLFKVQYDFLDFIVMHVHKRLIRDVFLTNAAIQIFILVKLFSEDFDQACSMYKMVWVFCVFTSTVFLFIIIAQVLQIYVIFKAN